jgi:tRNA nucleotidyltransferase (CCA-adding enzyme)
MEIITGHYGTDFDCLGAMIGAKKLYPRAACVLPGRVDRNVRDFLDLYEDAFRILTMKDIVLGKVARMVVVDTRRPHRLGKVFGEIALQGGTEIVVYDHHPESEDDIRPNELHWALVGATTTLVTEAIRDREIALTPTEATALALGIYEDTGSLSFSSTTVRDVLSVAFLLECGADLDIVSRYTRYSLNEEQREVLNQFVLSVQHHTYAGVKVATAVATVDDYVGDVAVLTHKLAVIEAVDALFTITHSRRNVYVVGRSRSDSLDVSAVLRPIGGGGHHRSASAVLPDRDVADVRAEVLARIEGCVRPSLAARDLMSYPVRMIDSETSVDDAKKVLLRYGYSGILVSEEGRIAGQVTLKELDRALHHNLGHAPVKSCMQSRVVFARPETPAPEIQEMLITHRVGRVPVIDPEGNLVGIVTRSDLRHGTRLPSDGDHRVYVGEFGGVQDVSDVLQGRRHDGLTQLLKRLGTIADTMGRPAFLVGGSVRDLLLGATNVDVDILIEGNGIEFAQRAAEELGARILTHGRFGTAVLALPDRTKIDVASARTEFYEAPGALPTVEVEHSSVKEDLYRRDFTINAMAVQINAERFGRLHDFFGGRVDLERGVVRVLHTLSFVEDPTRILRAVRFEQRLGFHLDDQTESLLAYALESELFEALTGERIRAELVLILSEADPIAAIHRLSHLAVWEHIHTKLVFDNRALDELRRTAEVLSWLASMHPPVLPQGWLAFLCPLLREMSGTQVRDLARRLRFTRDDMDELSLAIESPEFVLSALESDVPVRPSHVHQLLHPLPPLLLARALVLAQPEGPAEQRIAEYLTEMRQIQLSVRGEDLRSLGYRPGPPYGRILRRLLEERLDGGLTAEQEPARLAELAEEVYAQAE